MITSMNDLNNGDYYLGKVSQLLKKNIIHLDTELYEFINCYLNDSQWSYLYENEIKHRINQLYVLVIPIHIIKKLQKNMCISVFGTETYTHLVHTNNNFISGFIYINKRHATSNYKFIEVVDSRIGNLNIVKFMINKYEQKHKYKLLPIYIIKSAKDYWKKYLMNNFKLYSNEEIKHFICDIHENNYIVLNWDYLFI
jgi:hypothetical protein